jgi:hypothetical protein
MQFAKRLLMGVGAAALAAILGMAIAPKAAHALVAALVQVANTPTTAIPVVHAPAASDVYVGTCVAYFRADAGNTCVLPPAAAGKTLIIENASIVTQTETGADPTSAAIITGGGSAEISYYIPMQLQAPQFGIDDYTGQLQGRITVPSIGPSYGIPVSCIVQLGQNSSYGEMYCTVSGYMIPAN